MRLPLSPALSLLSRRLTAYEVKAGYDINRRWLEGTRKPDFILKGIFQPADDKALQFLSDGDRSKGASILHTRCKLVMTDNSEKKGPTKNQMYICDGDEIWRVVKIQDWQVVGGFYRYICVKYLNSKGHTLT